MRQVTNFKENIPHIGLMGTPFSPEQVALLRELVASRGYVLTNLTELSEPEAILPYCEILCGYFSKGQLQQAQQLRWLQLPCAGADRYAAEELYPHPGVVLTNSSGAFGAAIAEQLLMGSLMLLRRMPEYQRQQREKIWRRVGPLRFLRGSLVTVLGTGNLGGTFARYCRSLGATVRGVSRSGNPREDFDQVYPVERLKEAVAGSDIVAACLPLTGQTLGLIDKDVFDAMEAETIFLNAGRGKTVVQQDLIDALRQGRICGAMLDVAEEEPMPPDCPLWDMEQVIITPHVSGSDLDADNAAVIFEIFQDNLERYFAGRPLRNVVDKTKGY